MTIRWTDHDLQAYLRRDISAPITERIWQTTVRRIAKDAGFTFQYHVFDSRRTVYGYPDLTLVHREPGHPLYMIECKREDGQVTPAQAAWIEALGGCTGVVAEIWKPAQLEDICRRLRS